MSRRELAAALLAEIEKLPVIDTHEHLVWREEDRCADPHDVLSEYLIHYMSSDVRSAGMKPADFDRAIDPAGDVRARWALVEPYWEAARHTGYGRALDIAAAGIYGVPQVNAGTIETLNERFLAAKKPGHYHRVLRDLCRIETSLVDLWTLEPQDESPYFKCVWQPLEYIMPAAGQLAGRLANAEARHGITVRGLDDWLAALEAEMEERLALYGTRVLKSAIAYIRSLRFEKVPYTEAKPLFDAALAAARPDGSGPAADDGAPVFPTPLQDFMMHSVLKLAGARGLTFQFHTGLLEGNGNTLAHSDPSLLNNLFLEYPDVDFDLFHIGYPYQGVACALAKMFPNVTLDMCWAHIISPAASRAALDDFLDAVPWNKISAFGGDYCLIDGVYGHLVLARQNVAAVLAGKVAEGVFGEERALELARALFYGNPKRIFKL